MDLEQLTHGVRGAVGVKRVFGHPYEVDGVVMIPVARSIAGGGAGDGPNDQGSGGGFGFGFGFGTAAKVRHRRKTKVAKSAADECVRTASR